MRVLASIVVAGAFGLGWLSAGASARRPEPPATNEGPGGGAASAAARSRPLPVANASRRVPSPDELRRTDRQLLQLDAQAVAAQIAGRRPMVMALCKDAVPQADDAYCARVFAADERVIPKFIDTRQRLLRGEIDDETYRSQWHAHFLERQIALEQFMAYDEKLRYDGTPPGDDNFMVLTVWGMYLPEGYKLGLEDPQDWQQPETATTEEAATSPDESVGEKPE